MEGRGRVARSGGGGEVLPGGAGRRSVGGAPCSCCGRAMESCRMYSGLPSWAVGNGCSIGPTRECNKIRISLCISVYIYILILSLKSWVCLGIQGHTPAAAHGWSACSTVPAALQVKIQAAPLKSRSPYHVLYVYSLFINENGQNYLNYYLIFSVFSICFIWFPFEIFQFGFHRNCLVIFMPFLFVVCMFYLLFL